MKLDDGKKKREKKDWKEGDLKLCCAGPWFNEIDSVRRFTNNCVARVYRESCDLPSNRFIYYSRIAQENWVENMESAKEVTDPTISYYFIKSFSNLFVTLEGK